MSPVSAAGSSKTGDLTYLSRLAVFYSLKQVFSEAYSWLTGHGSVVFLAVFLLVWIDIVVRLVPKQLLADWAFWTAVTFWFSILLLTDYVSDHYTRVRHSIRQAISLGVLASALLAALAGFILRLGDLFWPPIFGLLSIFTVAAFQNVLQDVRRSRALPPIVPSPEEQDILRIAQELCYNLQLSKRFNPLYITWTSDIYSDEVSFEDGFQNRGLVLPLALKNKLSPEEWRVLIAVYLLRRKPHPGKSVAPVVKFFGPLVAYIIVFFYEFRAIISIPYADAAWFIGYVVIAAFALKPFLAEDKKQSLVNDRVAAKQVGNELFLSVLKKIDDLKLRDMQRLSAKRDLRARVLSFFRSTLQERMDNLTGT